MSTQRIKPAISMADLKPELERLRRRGFLRSALSLGALTMLTGCDLSNPFRRRCRSLGDAAL